MEVIIVFQLAMLFFASNVRCKPSWTDIVEMNTAGDLQTKNSGWACKVLLANGLLKLVNATTFQDHKGVHPRDCLGYYRRGYHKDGVYKIDPQINGYPVKAFCDMTTDGGGWTVFQKRVDPSMSFQKNWQAYKHGFGDLNGNSWLGLDILHELSKVPSTLRVDLKNVDGSKGFAKYDNFKIDDETNQYQLHISGYNGDIGDGFLTTVDLNNQYFYATDNDGSGCVVYHGGPWWYHSSSCACCELNGIFPQYTAEGILRFMSWYAWKSNWGDINYSSMKIRGNN